MPCPPSPAQPSAAQPSAVTDWDQLWTEAKGVGGGVREWARGRARAGGEGGTPEQAPEAAPRRRYLLLEPKSFEKTTVQRMCMQ